MDDTAFPPPDVEILPPAPDVAVTALTQDVGDGKWYAILDFTCVRARAGEKSSRAPR